MTDTLGPVDLLVVGGGMAGLTAAASAHPRPDLLVVGAGWRA